MDPRDSDIVDPELAVVPPPYLNGLILIGEDHVNCLFPCGFSRVGLHNEVGLVRLLIGQHFDILLVVQTDDVGEQGLADLAFKLGEVVGDGYVASLFLYFALYPRSEALQVHQCA